MRRMPPGRGRPLGALGDLAEQLVVERGVLAARADEAVADAAGELRRERAGRGHEDRHGLVGAVVDRRLPGAVEVAPRSPPAPRVQSRRISSIASARRSRRSLRPGNSPPVTGVSFMASPVPTPRKTRPGVRQAERGERLGDHRRVVAQRRREDARAEHGALGALAGRGEPGQRRRRVAAACGARAGSGRTPRRSRDRRARLDGELEQRRRGRTAPPRPCSRSVPPWPSSYG